MPRTKCVRFCDLLLPLPALSRGEGWGEGLSSPRILRTRRPAVNPPHPKFSRCANFDLSPQAGRGEASVRPSDVMIAAGETQPGLDLGDLGAAHGNAMRRGAIELDHGADTFLAIE